MVPAGTSAHGSLLSWTLCQSQTEIPLIEPVQKSRASSEDLDACRLKYQPALDTLKPDDLDQAAQTYLDQEAWIEGAQNSLKSQTTLKKPRQHPQIRRWKAQYRPYQVKKGSKKLHKNIWDSAIKP